MQRGTSGTRDGGAPLSAEELAAWRGFLRTHATLVRVLDEELQDEMGLSVPAYEVLMLVAREPGGRVRISELSRRTLLSLSGTSRLVDRLVREGLARKEACAEDRRGANVVLTESGRALVDRAGQVHRAGVRRLFLERLEPGDLAALAAAWRRLGTGDPPAD
ncbi:MAG TPA: MarR family transcriptional regulator [Miltoncostaeaceae bacterium]|nr:MarR family transcriptional regulator [Miltoncostaeaceae bacterium]